MFSATRHTGTVTPAAAAMRSASSTMGFRPMGFAPRFTAVTVMTALGALSTMRCASASELKPPKTTEWMAPRRAHASIATGSSTRIGR